MPYSGMHENSSITKAFRVLFHVARQDAPISLADLSSEVGLSKPTVHRIATLLETAGVLHKDEITRRYSVGQQFHEVCFYGLRSGPAHSKRLRVLQRLSEKANETVNLGVLSGSEVVYLERVEAPWPLRLEFKPGSRFPIHCTAVGKLLLAFAPRRRRQQLLELLSLQRYTEHTITDLSKLQDELLGIRDSGYSEDREEFMTGVSCIAVPVKDRADVTVAALAISAPTARLPLDQARTFLPDLWKSAEELREYLA